MANISALLLLHNEWRIYTQVGLGRKRRHMAKPEEFVHSMEALTIGNKSVD